MVLNRDFLAAGILLVVALLFGGAGLNYPRLELLIELTAVGVAAYFAVSQSSWKFDASRKLALGLLALVVALPIAQLLPLPPALWHQLPGRDLAGLLDPQLGLAQAWRPLTLNVEGTIRAVIGLAPPAAMFVACLFLTTQQRILLLWIVVGFALLGALIGGVQLATGGGMTPYPSAHLGYPIGLFVNRNHQAALALIAIPIVGALVAIAPRRRSGFSITIIFFLAAITMLAITVIGTTSRMGTILLPFAVLIAFMIAFAGQSLMRFVAPSLLGAGALAAVVVTSGLYTRTMSRVASLDDARYSYWTDTLYAIQQYRIAGTGFGTFVPVYQSIETLTNLSSTYLNHAHNDFYELTLEGGWPAIMLLLLFAVFLGAATFRLIGQRSSLQRRVTGVAALSGILAILCYSLTDYPLRMSALSTVFAFLCALLLPGANPGDSDVPAEGRRRGSRPILLRRWLRPVLVSVAALGLSFVMVQAAFSAHALLRQQYDVAARWAPWSTAAAEKQADTLLLTQRPEDAVRPALRALRLSPLSVPAIRTLGMTKIERGQREPGNALMNMAAGRGWRDPITQLWTIQAALATGEADKAAQRAEAMFIVNTFPTAALDALGQTEAGVPALNSLARRLGENPPWRASFMRLGWIISPSEVSTYFAVLQRLSEGRSPPTAAEVAPFIDRSLELGNLAEAKRMWNLTHGVALIENGNFSEVTGSADKLVPRGWSRQSKSNLSVSIERVPGWAGGRTLRIFGSGGSNSVVAQRILLDPGAYTVTYWANVSRSQRAVLDWGFRCRGKGNWTNLSPKEVRRVGKWQQLQASLIVPNKDCADATFALRVQNGSYEPTLLWLDAVLLRRATSTG